MQIISVSALSLFVASAFAADCFGNSGAVDAYAEVYWDARAKMCGNTDCPYQQDCTTRSFKRIPSRPDYTFHVAFIRKHTGKQKGFKECWAATEQIINQCFYSAHKLGGTWENNGQLYEVNGWTDLLGDGEGGPQQVPAIPGDGAEGPEIPGGGEEGPELSEDE